MQKVKVQKVKQKWICIHHHAKTVHASTCILWLSWDMNYCTHTHTRTHTVTNTHTHTHQTSASGFDHGTKYNTYMQLYIHVCRFTHMPWTLRNILCTAHHTHASNETPYLHEQLHAGSVATTAASTHCRVSRSIKLYTRIYS